MADLKMVTEGELLSAGYSARTTNNRISDDYCPTVEFFMSGWYKEGYQLEDINNIRQNDELFALDEIVESKEAANPTWDMPSSIDIDKYGWGCGPGSYTITITDEDEVGWMVVAPDWVDVSGNCGHEYANGTFVSTITGQGNTEVTLSSDSYETQKAGTIYLKPLDGSEEYDKCSLTQKALSWQKTSMTIYFNGMNSNFKNEDNPRLFIWDPSGEYFFELGTDFDPSTYRRRVTITKDLYDKIVSSSYNDASTTDSWKIGCTDSEGELSFSYVYTFNIMANNVAGIDVLNSIVEAWQNGNDSVIITVSYTEETITCPTWDLTTEKTSNVSDYGTDITFKVTDEDGMGYSFSADSTTSFFSIIDGDNTGNTIEWNSQTGGTKEYILRIKVNSVYYSRIGTICLVYNNSANTVVKKEVEITQDGRTATSTG